MMTPLRMLHSKLFRSLAGAAVVVGGCSLSLGCASVRVRPVPLPEEGRTLPAWYPEQPWDKGVKGDRIYLQGKVVFDTSRHQIRAESEAVLQQLLAYLEANPDVSRVRLEGHTDSRAGDEYNQALSERRAISVADWLVDRGLDHFRILAVAFGESKPLVPNDSATNMQENRRTEFHVAEVSGVRFRNDDPTAGGLVLEVKSKEEREKEKAQAKIPTYIPPPVNPTRDIIEPVPPEKRAEDRVLDVLIPPKSD